MSALSIEEEKLHISLELEKAARISKLTKEREKEKVVVSKTSSSSFPVSLGMHVLAKTAVGEKNGILRFIGPTRFAEGEWFGVEFRLPVGKNNGSVDGIKYFECMAGHGLFLKGEAIKRSEV